MIWDISLAVAHAALLLMFGRVFCRAPDMLQKLGVMLPMIIGAMVQFAYHASRAANVIDESIAIVATGLLIQNFGVSVMVVRLFLKEIGLCKNFSVGSRNSTDC